MAWVGMLVTLVSVACARLAFGLVLPQMRAGLHLSYAQAGTLGTLTALGYLLMLIPAGQLARRWSARGSVLIGLTLNTLGFVGLWGVQSLGPLRLLMVLLGLGTALVFTPLVSLLTAWFPARRGTVIGLASSGVGVGLLLTGVLLPRLTHAYGPGSWRLMWAAFALLGVLVLALAAAVLREAPRAGGRPERVPGASLRVYRSAGVLRVGGAYGLGGLAYSVQTLFMLSFTLQSGVSPAVAGTLVAVHGLLSVFAGVGWGWLSDRLGRGPAMMLAGTLTLVAMTAPLAWPHPAAFALHWVLLGLTISGYFTLLQAAGTEEVPHADAPLALSAITVFFAVGQFVGPSVAGLLVEHGGFRAAFALSAAAVLVSLALTVWRYRAGRRDRQAVPDGA
ncbi:MFS transporter [Deinococcus aquiradiocola]|nr:MFS transporter [Deinococcus aquiradiocola]